MQKEKTIMIELAYTNGNKDAYLKLTCEEPMDDEDVYLALEDFLQHNAFNVYDGGESIH